MLQVLEAATQSGTEWLLTSDLHLAREYLAAQGWIEIGVHDPCQILADQYHGVACLTSL